MSLEDSDKKQKEKSLTNKVPLPEEIFELEDESTKALTKKVEPKNHLTSEQERETTDQDPKVNYQTEFDSKKETNEKDKTLLDIAEQISLAESAILQEQEDIKKGRKIKEILESGKIFQDKYEIIKMIGSGGMGQVYLANHTNLGSKIAIKVLNTNFVGEEDEESIDRFKREAKATAAIDHPNAVKVFDFGVQDNICYLVMEYLNGESLRKRLSRLKRFSIKEVFNLIEQVCSVLEVMHRKGIVHRDLKPDNIFFHNQEDREIVKVLDFGIAKVSGSTISEGKLTSTGALLGTPHYMSPEQCQGMKLDGRSDLYSFGIIVYELLSGTLPFEAENTLSMLFKHVRDNPINIKSIVPDLPQSIADIVMKSLEKHPKTRYQTAKEFALAFEEAVNTISLPEKTTSTSSSLEKGKTSDLGARSTIETAMLPVIKNSENEQILESSKENDESKLYNVDTQKNKQPLLTRPVGRVISENLQEPFLVAKKESLNEIKASQAEVNKYVTKNNQFIKYVLPLVGLTLLVTFIGIWKSMPNANLIPNATPTPINNSNNPNNALTEKELLTKENFVFISKTKVTLGTNGKKCDYVPDCKIEDFEKPAHEITLNSYYISKYEVTNEDYYKFTKETDYQIPLGWDKVTKSFLDGTAKLPVNQISWEDALAYCKWRKEKENIDFRLPTEAEWEYAAKGNTDILFPWGDDWDPSFVYGAKPADRIKNPSSIEVPPNNSSDRSPFGIFAMSGNVAEWTSSKFDAYPGSAYEKKVTPKDRECIVVKGGSFNASPTDLRVTSRAWYEPNKKDSNIGFRLAITPKEGS